MTYSEKLKHPKWQKKRLEILNRDNFTCVYCGAFEKTLHVHHISYNGSPWDTENRLFLTLCEECHKEEEVDLEKNSAVLINKLRAVGFTSVGLGCLPNLFKDTDRQWIHGGPPFDIIKMVIDDDSLWSKMSDLFFERLPKNPF